MTSKRSHIAVAIRSGPSLIVTTALLLSTLVLGAVRSNAQIQTSVPSLTGFIQTDATACPPQSYIVTGTNISADVDITAPAGFEISEDQITWVAPPAFITIGQNGPTTIPATTIYVRLNTAGYGTYTGNIVHTSTDSPNLTLAVDGVRSAKSPTTTALLSSPEPSVYGQTVTLTADVTSPLPGTPTGTVTFYDDATSLGTSALNGSASASLSTSLLAFGGHSLTAVYASDANFDASTSPVVSHLVRGTTTTVVASDNNPSINGQSVTFTATVSTTFPGTPTGSVTFFDGATSLGSALLAAGDAQFSTSGLAPGSHSITATYDGDAAFNTSTSSALGQDVRSATTTGLTSNHNPSVSGQPVTLTATVSSVTPGVIAGTVSFFDAGNPVGTPVTLSGGIAEFTAAYPASSSPHSFTAAFNGGVGYAASTSSAVNQIVNKSATLPVVTADHNPSYIGQTVTFTATVNPVSPGGGTPTGTVTFSVDGTPTAPVTLSGGLANYSTAALSFGGHVVDASYGGDINYNPGVSAPYPDTVGPRITATAGAHGSITPAGVVGVAFGSSTVFTMTPDPGYHVDSIIVDDAYAGDSLSYTFTNVTADRTIRVAFAINRYPLGVIIAGNGSVSKNPDQALYDHGSGVDLTATPAAGYLFDGWSGDASGAANPLTVTMDTAKSVTANFVVDPVYLTEFRTASMTDWATAVDHKGKPYLVKCKPDKVEFRFRMLVPPLATGFKLKIGMISTGTVTRGPEQIASWTGTKELSVTGIAEGETLTVSGWGTKGKIIKPKLEWSPKTSQGMVVAFDLNQPHLQMPNLINVMSELGSWPTIGNAGGASSVIHPTYKHVLKSLNKKGTLHTGSAGCLDVFIGGKPFEKQQKSLPPTKANNKLFAEALALALNVGASASGNFPPGLAALIYQNEGDPASGTFNGSTVGSILTRTNSFLGCVPDPAASADDYFSVLSAINGAFRDSTVDTASWSCAGVKMTGVKALVEVPFLRAPAGFAVPMVEPVAAALPEPEEFLLSRNYPNPFNPSTVISYSLPVGGYVTIRVYNTLGEEVATLLDNALADEGDDEVEFNGSNLSSGVYFCLLTINPIDEEGNATGTPLTQVSKMMLMK